MRMYGEATSTFRAFVGDFFTFNSNNPSEFCAARELAMNEEILEAYKRVCDALSRIRARWHKSAAAPVLLEGMLGEVERRDGGEELSYGFPGGEGDGGV
jgi:hypothetical protein